MCIVIHGWAKDNADSLKTRHFLTQCEKMCTCEKIVSGFGLVIRYFSQVRKIVWPMELFLIKDRWFNLGTCIIKLHLKQNWYWNIPICTRLCIGSFKSNQNFNVLRILAYRQAFQTFHVRMNHILTTEKWRRFGVNYANINSQQVIFEDRKI